MKLRKVSELDKWDWTLIVLGFFWLFQLVKFFGDSPQAINYLLKPGVMNCLQKIESMSLNNVPRSNQYNSCADVISALDDEHAKYFTKKEQESFELYRTNEAKQIGLKGMTIEPDGNAYKYSILEVVKDSIAQKAGVLPGDAIISINGKISKTLNPQQFYEELFKDPDQIEFELQNKTGTRKLVIKKQLVKVVNVTSAVKENIGLIKLNIFSFNTYDDIVQAAKPLLANPAVDTIVLDLRDNGGGLLKEGIKVGGAFLPTGSLYGTEVTKNSRQEFRTTGQPIFDGKKIIVAMNRNSASASEITAIALEDNMPSRVTLIGTKSYGKGSEQVAMKFWSGDGMKFTVGKILNPSGSSHDKIGISPEVEKDLKGDLFDKSNFEFLKTIK
jgi:carboxyl-terminal processing protease